MPFVPKKKPDWLKTRIPGGARYRQVKNALDTCGIHTVCQEAHCPNVGECWEAGTATFMILGDMCTRGCRFCAVERGDPGGNFEDDEPDRVASVIKKMGLDYAVITSVTRDDLSDGGAAIFAETVRACKALENPPLVELLIPDYLDQDLGTVLESKPDVLAHNIEVVERLSSVLRHKRFSYKRSLETLEQARRTGNVGVTKSSIMLGLGESDAEIEASMRDLRGVGVDILVLGQYLRPTRAHIEVVEYVSPNRFSQWEIRAKELGFGFVAAGPLVRTSYKAAEAFARHLLS